MSIDGAKNSKRGRPRVESEAVNVRMERSLLDAIDAWIARQDDLDMGRPEAVRRILAHALIDADNDSPCSVTRAGE